jgi:hypothetical protein
MQVKLPKAKKKFTKEMADIVIELGKQGASQKTMYAAIGISKDTAARWKKDNEDFAETMSMATTLSQSWWESQILANIENKSWNSRVAELALKGQFPDDYGLQRMDVKSNVKQEVVVDFAGEIQKLIASLK